MNLSGAPLWVSAGLGVIAVVALAAIVFWVARRMTRGLNFSDGGQRGKRSRLGVIDAFDIDRQRRLILLRRDNVEHLVMIGGPNDVLIEPTIRRGVAQAARSQAASSGQPATTPTPANLHPREVPPPTRPSEPTVQRITPVAVPPEPALAPRAANVAQRMSASPSPSPVAPPRTEPQPAARPDADRPHRSEPASVTPTPTTQPQTRSRLADSDLAAMAHKLEEALRRPGAGAPAGARAPTSPAPEPLAPKPAPAPAPKPAQAPPPAPPTGAMWMPTALSMPSATPARPARTPDPQPKPPAPSSSPKSPQPPGPVPGAGASETTKPGEAPRAQNPVPSPSEGQKPPPRPPAAAQPGSNLRNDMPDLDSLEAEMAKLLGRPPMPGDKES